MRSPKYVITELNGMVNVHILAAHEQHCDFINIYNDIVSAGFFQIFVNANGAPDISCYGKSVTLEVESRPEIDSRLLQRFFNLLD